MRIIFVITLFLAGIQTAHSQFVCFSDSIAIYEFPGADLPAMEGAAVFESEGYKVVVGGKFSDPESPDEEGVYNCDMIVVDEKAKKTYVLPLSFFPPGVADQFSAAHFCYTMDKDTAYIMGGYGFDWAAGYETTLPLMTIFPLKTLIDSVVQKKDYFDLFEVVYDDRLAITEGNLVRIGAYFLVYNGREIKPIIDEYTDQRTVNEWDFQGQLRKFTLKNTEGYREVDEFQICYNSKVFYQCMPDKWRPAIEPVEDRNND
ncbi:MAG: hypothetical protein DYG98_26075 [Haliscomenobacteraceae bacterium CHB4]|nr:hypothetical protein [Saprospiraceae bacterium]MCE7926530.1 hypothetical protein [Haliscomenobacteraceae bacterium CHB4]